MIASEITRLPDVVNSAITKMLNVSGTVEPLRPIHTGLCSYLIKNMLKNKHLKCIFVCLWIRRSANLSSGPDCWMWCLDCTWNTKLIDQDPTKITSLSDDGHHFFKLIPQYCLNMIVRICLPHDQTLVGASWIYVKLTLSHVFVVKRDIPPRQPLQFWHV